MTVPALSLGHLRHFMERSIGPMQQFVERLAAEPGALSAVRAEFDALAVPYYTDNLLRQGYLLTRALAR